MTQKILIIDDSKLFRQLVARMIKKHCPEFELDMYDPNESGRPDKSFKWADYDLLILDYFLGEGQESGVDWLTGFRKMPGFPPTILVTGEGTEKVAVEAMKAGADDYLPKEGLEAESLVEMVRANIRTSERLGVLESNTAVKQFLHKLQQSMLLADQEHVGLFYVEMDTVDEIREAGGILRVGGVMQNIEQVAYHLVSNMFPNYEWVRWNDSTIAFFVRGKVNEKSCLAVGKALCEQALKRQLETTNGFLSTTLSIGIVIIEESSVELKVGLKRAEAAVKAAKIKGGDTAQLFPRETNEDKLSKTSVYRIQIKEKSAALGGARPSNVDPIEVQKAIKDDRFEMQYHPLLMLSNEDQGSGYFYDLLPSYHDYAGNTLSNDEVIAGVYDSEDVAEYDFFVCRTAMKLATEFTKAQSAQASMVITPVSQSIQQRHFFQRLHELIKKFEGRKVGQSMVFRININDYIEQPQHVLKYFFELKKHGGVRFCLTNVDRADIFSRVQQHKMFDYLELSGVAEAELLNGTSEDGVLRAIQGVMQEKGGQLIARGIDSSEQLMNAIVSNTFLAQGAMLTHVMDEMSTEVSAMTDIEL